MDILFASSEAVPFAKTGGLADVVGALPGVLAKQGHRVTVVLPGYDSVFSALDGIPPKVATVQVPVGRHLVGGAIRETAFPESGIPVLIVDQPYLFRRPGIYGEEGRDYPDNCERFVFFCRATLEAARLLNRVPDLWHVHDWQTGLIPALLKTEYWQTPGFRESAALITIHNLAYQGRYPAAAMACTGIDHRYFHWQQMEFHGHLNLLKTGLVFADAISTVSPTYAHEIQGPEQGYGLEGLLRERSGVLTGILNGIDPAAWNPATDRHLVATYDVQSWREGKGANKRALQRELGLAEREDVPLIGIVGRLAEQKGWSLILEVMHRWAPHREVQWAILGTGQPEYHRALAALAAAFPGRVAARLAFSNPLAHRIEAGSDLFLMPSQYEPCGLNQMYSMAYGTVPVVRRTGGLADTVVDAGPEELANGTATGFQFVDFAAGPLEAALERATGMWERDPHLWGQLVETGMQRDWSWTASARQYSELYRATVDRCRRTAGFEHVLPAGG